MGVVFSNSALLAVCGEQPITLGLSSLGAPYGTHSDNNLIICNQFLALEASLVDEKCPVETLPPSLFVDFYVECLHKCIYFRKFLLN